jgi:hypothetical protein
MTSISEFISEHDAEDDLIKESLADTQASLAAAEEELANVNSDLAGAKSDNATQATTITNLNATITKLRADLAALQKAYDALKASTNSTTPPATPPVAGWKEDWTDNFNTIDTTRWAVKNNTYASNENSYLLAKNVSIENGVLRVQAKNEAVGGKAYTSGYIQSTYTLPNYFRVEFKSKLPIEQGMWPAPVWFRPSDSAGGAAEIDVIEAYGKYAGRGYYTMHVGTNYDTDHFQSQTIKPFTDDWHVWVIEKKPNLITITCDGVEVGRFGPASTFNKVAKTTTTYSAAKWNEAFENASRKWTIRCNLQVGGTWGGLPDATTDWTPDKTAMFVDYIKTWVPA